MTDLGSIDRKIEWAEHHIGHLQDALATFAESNPYEVVLQDHPDDPERVQFVLQVLKPIPVEVSLILGDVVHALRSALDHLACIAAGTMGNTNIAFPIWRKPVTPTTNQLEALAKGKVNGASRPVLQQFLTLQPYEGGKDEMLWCLDSLDVIDKHRLLLPALASHESVDVDFARAMRMTFPDFSGIDDLPMQVISLRPADHFPLNHGDVLFDLPRHEIEKQHPTFTIGMALGQPEPIKGKSLTTVIPDLVETVKRTIEPFRVLLTSPTGRHPAGRS